MWTQDQGCEETIDSAWQQQQPGSKVSQFKHKMKSCRHHLRWWGWTVFGSIHSQLKKTRQELKEAEECSMANGSHSRVRMLRSDLGWLLAKRNECGINVQGLYGYRMEAKIQSFSTVEHHGERGGIRVLEFKMVREIGLRMIAKSKLSLWALSADFPNFQSNPNGRGTYSGPSKCDRWYERSFNKIVQCSRSGSCSQTDGSVEGSRTRWYSSSFLPKILASSWHGCY